MQFEEEIAPEVWEEFVSRRNGALLGCDFVTTFKDKYIWEVGKEYIMADFMENSLYMAGTFTPKDPSLRNVIIAHRDYLQEIDGKQGQSSQIFVLMEDREYMKEAINGIEALDFPVAIRVESAQEAMDQAIVDLNDMLWLASYVILITSLVILIGIANTISMSTYDRSHELGVLRSIGFDKWGVLRLVMFEAGLLGLLGGALGCLVAFLVLHFGAQKILVMTVEVPIEMRPMVLGVGVGISLLVGLLGGLLPALRASRLKIVDSMRRAE